MPRPWAGKELPDQFVKATGIVVTIPPGVVTATNIVPAKAPDVGGIAEKL